MKKIKFLTKYPRPELEWVLTCQRIHELLKFSLKMKVIRRKKINLQNFLNQKVFAIHFHNHLNLLRCISWMRLTSLSPPSRDPERWSENSSVRSLYTLCMEELSLNLWFRVGDSGLQGCKQKQDTSYTHWQKQCCLSTLLAGKYVVTEICCHRNMLPHRDTVNTEIFYHCLHRNVLSWLTKICCQG